MSIIELKLGAYQDVARKALEDLARKRVIERIWNKDHTVWKPAPTEIVNRLGWLDVAAKSRPALPRLAALRVEARRDGLTRALLMGMGGSSLAPEVFRRTFGVSPDGLDLAVIDSTDADYVLDSADRFDPRATLHVVSTKSGGTVETFSFFRYFYNRAKKALGEAEAGKRFIAITDPGSLLAELAEKLKFRTTFLNDPDIGGRYSALSFFGLAPAGLVGVDLGRLLDRADAMAKSCGPQVDPRQNPAAILGAAIGALALQGLDKITFIASPQIASLGDWIEQLIAESTGKEGKGALPIVNEPLGAPASYGRDRLFVQLKLEGDDSQDAAVAAIAAAGHPLIAIKLADLHDLGAQFFLWELATAVAGERLGINPFDQPNVEAAKKLARKMVDEYKQSGALPKPKPAFVKDGVEVFGPVSGEDVAAAVVNFIQPADPAGYVCVQAYIKPSAAADRALAQLRKKLCDRSRLAVAVGYGPRFLHSTGQLHKGDSGKGLFIQITSDPRKDAPIPDDWGKDDSSISFGVLKLAQALGDGEALREAGRKVIRLHLGPDPEARLAALAEKL